MTQGDKDSSMTTPGSAPRESFIPLRRSDLIAECVVHSDHQGGHFSQFCEILLAYLHHQHLGVLERAKDAYAPFNPDRDTLRVGHDETPERAAAELAERFKEILSCANYLPVSSAELNRALQEISMIPLHTEVDFEDFEEYALYYRGEALRKITVRQLFKAAEREVESYERVAMMLRFKDRNYMESKSQKKKEMNFTPGMTYLFLYKDVPKQDLELLFPNVKVWMTWKDRLLFIGPLLAGLGPMVIKILPSIGLLLGALALYTIGPETARTFDFDEKKHLAVWPIMVAALSSSMLLVGFAVKQFLNYKNKKLHFLKRVTETLFFKNLVTNQGVLMAIVDSAEEELGKEMVLAYHHLLTYGPLTKAELDGRVESWLLHSCARSIDFDVAKALDRLSAIEADGRSVVYESGGRWHALELAEAKAVIDRRWDEIFSFQRPDDSEMWVSRAGDPAA